MKLSSATVLLFSVLAISFAKAQPPAECGRECEPSANDEDGLNKKCRLVNPDCPFCQYIGDNIGICVPKTDAPTPSPSEAKCGRECEPSANDEDGLNKRCYLINPDCPYCQDIGGNIGICVPKTDPPTLSPSKSKCGQECDPISGMENEMNEQCRQMNPDCPYCPEGICIPEIELTPSPSVVICGQECDPISGMENEINEKCRQMNPDCPYCIVEYPSLGNGKCMPSPPMCGHPCLLPPGQGTQPNEDCMNVSPNCPFCIPDGGRRLGLHLLDDGSTTGTCAQTPSEQRRLRSNFS